MIQLQPNVVLEEEHPTAATPEPKEEEKAPPPDTEEALEVDVEAWMHKIRSGWTLASATGTSIGELYLIVSVCVCVCMYVRVCVCVCVGREDEGFVRNYLYVS